MTRLRLIVFILAASLLRVSSEDFRVVYEWFKLDFSWPNDKTKSDAYLQGHYIPENNVIKNIRIWKDRAFLTLPRSRPGVPVTLATVGIVPRGGSISPRLDPFPSWYYQETDKCECLQNVQSVEIDPDGFIWVVDAGSVKDVITDQKCNPKILIFNTDKRELLSKKEFVDLEEDSVLGDIVLDPRHLKTAYISINTKTRSLILVYTNRTYYTIAGLPTFDSKKVIVNGTSVFLRNKLSLALSLTENKLYFSSSLSYNLYSVSLFYLLNGENISEYFQNLGNKTGLSSGMIIDSKHNLYLGLIEKDSVAKFNLTYGDLTGVETFQDRSLMQWPDSFSFDDSGSIWVVTNRFQTYLDGGVNVEVPNFRLVQAYTGSRSYLYGKYSNWTTSSATRNEFYVIVFITVVKVFESFYVVCNFKTK